MNVYNFVLYNVYLHKYVNVFNDNENEYSNNICIKWTKLCISY